KLKCLVGLSQAPLHLRLWLVLALRPPANSLRVRDAGEQGRESLAEGLLEIRCDVADVKAHSLLVCTRAHANLTENRHWHSPPLGTLTKTSTVCDPNRLSTRFARPFPTEFP